MNYQVFLEDYYPLKIVNLILILFSYKQVQRFYCSKLSSY